MSDALSAEAFLPCLIDRLTDEEPENTRERPYHMSVTMAHLRRSVLRDMRWLLNTPAHEGEEFEEFEGVAASVLNYGAPDLSGRTASSLNIPELERALERCIIRFEPRILSLTVRAVANSEKLSPHVIGFEISGLMWANPLPERFLLQTQIDLETGQCEF